MRIAFDGKKAAANRAGLGNYSRFVIRCMAQRYPDCQIDVYVAKEKDPALLDSLRELPNVSICYPKHSLLRFFPKLWSVYGIPAELRKRGADIFHGLGNELPRNIAKAEGTKSIVTIHDLIFVSFAHTYTWIDRHLYNIRFRHACKVSDRIVAVSRYTAKDIVKYYFTPKEKISVVYQGCDMSFRKRCTESFNNTVRKAFSLPSRYILSVGTIEERKNTALIVKALPSIPDLHLVLVGKKTPYMLTVVETARKLGVMDRVHILNSVGFNELPSVYQQAEVFVYPSRYEGFGIPVLEALCSGVPVIAATGSCLEEAGGDAAVYIDPDDYDALAQAIIRITENQVVREEMVSKGFAYAEKFKDDTLAENLMAVYKDLITHK